MNESTKYFRFIVEGYIDVEVFSFFVELILGSFPKV